MAKANGDGMTNEAGVAYGELIRRQRKLKQMNQEELGALVGIRKNAVGAWEAGRSRPDVGSVPIICDALGLTLEEFFGRPAAAQRSSALTQQEEDNLLRRFAELNEYNRQVTMRQMEVLYEMQMAEEEKKNLRKVIRLYRNDLAASAGTGEPLAEAQGQEVYIYADPLAEKADEIITVNGDSMEPTYSDGDMLYVKHVSALRPGQIGVFVCGGSGFVKEYRKDGLHSHNPRYGVIGFSDGEEVRCIGRVLGRVKQEDLTDEKSYLAWVEAERKGS